MNIGIIGAGNVGTSLARIWVKNGHRVMLSFSRDEAKLQTVTENLGTNASTGSPREAANFGEVLVLAVPWDAVTEAIEAAGPLSERILFSTVNALNADVTGLEVGTTTSAAEEIAKLAPGARVIEALPPFAELLATGSAFVDGQQGTIFCCGDDSDAKTIVSQLLSESGMEVIDAGPLSQARFIEPTMMLLVRLAYGRGFGGQIAFRFLRKRAKTGA
jgi:predicted dinucleotide-binding enzyme